MERGYVSEFMIGGRISSIGKISDLSKVFSLPGKTPFSICIRPKAETDEIDALLTVRCYQANEGDLVEAPFMLYDWSPLAIVEIASNETFLTKFDIWWGAGSYVNKSAMI